MHQEVETRASDEEIKKCFSLFFPLTSSASATRKKKVEEEEERSATESFDASVAEHSSNAAMQSAPWQ